MIVEEKLTGNNIVKTRRFLSPIAKVGVMVVIAVINGVLYGATISEHGGDNLKRFLHASGKGTNILIHCVSAEWFVFYDVLLQNIRGIKT